MGKKIFPAKVIPATIRAGRRAGDDYGATAQPDWRDVDWRAHLQQREVAGRSVNYVDIGEDGEHRPVLFVHGLGGQWQNWLENIPRMAGERRVVALDLPGFGHSEMPREEHTITGMAAVVEELCEQLGLGGCVVVGNSMGGFVSAELAIREPQRVERLVLVSAAGISQAETRQGPAQAVMNTGAAIAAWTSAQQHWIARRPKLRHYALTFVARHPSRLKADLAWEALMSGTGAPGFRNALRASLNYDFRHRLSEIGCPTLIVWGDKDPMIPVRDAEQFAQLIPDSRTVILEDTAHISMVERPETFNGLLMDFVHDGQPVPSQGATA